jgi:hypothetical protein
MAIPRRRYLKIDFRLGHGTIPGPDDGEEVPLVEVEIVDVEGRVMGGEELELDVIVGS